MKKTVLFVIIMLITCVCASADTTVSYDFNEYGNVADVVPGRLFSVYTNKAPELKMFNGCNCLAIGSDDDSDNILLTDPQSFNNGGFKLEFNAAADSAPAAGWGRAPHIIIRYKNAAGIRINDTIAEFANDAIRVRENGKEIIAAALSTEEFYSFSFDFTRKDNTFELTYRIGGNEYKKSYPTCKDGDICIGFFSYLGNAIYLKNISYSETYSNALTETEIKQAFAQQGSTRPRILMNYARLNRIRRLIADDERFGEWYRAIKTKADAALEAPISKYELRDGERLLYVSRDVYANSVYPAFVYLVEGNDKYIDRAWKELSAAAGFQDWHPAHFLDTAEMTFAFAICYDWLYDYWEEDQREVIKTAIRMLGLDAAKEAYDGTAFYDSNVYGAYHNRTGWKNDESNWGLVCNGGVAVGAMAIMDDANADYCADILEDAMYGLEKPMTLYGDDGAWLEGIGYWHYGTQYLVYMLSSMENTLGDSFGYTESSGLKNAANYLSAHTGTEGVFNYGDCAENAITAPELFWLAGHFRNANMNELQLKLMSSFGIKPSLDDVIYFDSDIRAENISEPKSVCFDSVSVVTARSSFDFEQENYIAMKAGQTGVAHGDLDAGTFIIDALGERWVTDYGSDLYTLDGYFDWQKRINYYRKRAEGHSTLVIGPGTGADQVVGAYSPITDHVFGEYGMLAAADLSAAYAGSAEKVRRAISLFENNSRFMVQDEVEAKAPADVYWFLQTDKMVSLSLDKKAITLSSGNKRLLMVLESNNEAAGFSVSAAKPLSTSPKPAGQASNNGYMRICVANNGVTDLRQRVTFIPYMAGDTVNMPAKDELCSIDELIAAADFDTEYKDVFAELYIDGKRTYTISEGKAEIAIRINKTANIYVACFDENSVLKEIKYFKDAVGNVKADFNVKENDTVSIFTWDKSMKPYEPVISFTKGFNG